VHPILLLQSQVVVFTVSGLFTLLQVHTELHSQDGEVVVLLKQLVKPTHRHPTEVVVLLKQLVKPTHIHPTEVVVLLEQVVVLPAELVVVLLPQLIVLERHVGVPLT
jgi:hypothetical protein